MQHVAQAIATGLFLLPALFAHEGLSPDHEAHTNQSAGLFLELTCSCSAACTTSAWEPLSLAACACMHYVYSIPHQWCDHAFRHIIHIAKLSDTYTHCNMLLGLCGETTLMACVKAASRE